MDVLKSAPNADQINPQVSWSPPAIEPGLHHWTAERILVVPDPAQRLTPPLVHIPPLSSPAHPLLSSPLSSPPLLLSSPQAQRGQPLVQRVRSGSSGAGGGDEVSIEVSEVRSDQR